MLGNDLVSISRWGVEVRFQNGLDCVCQLAEVLLTALCATKQVDVYERHIGNSGKLEDVLTT